MKKYLNYLLFTQDIGFIFFQSFTKKKTFLNLFIFFIKKTDRLNKYLLIYFLREITLKILCIFYLIPGLFLFFFKFKFAVSNSNSIGSYCEELISIIGKNNKKYKLILLEPVSYVDNPNLTEMYFKNEFFKIKSNFLSIMFLPFTYIDFLRITGFENKTNLYFQKQFYNFKTKVNNNAYIFDHEILFRNHKNFNLISDFISKNNKKNKNIKKKKKFVYYN